MGICCVTVIPLASDTAQPPRIRAIPNDWPRILNCPRWQYLRLRKGLRVRPFTRLQDILRLLTGGRESVTLTYILSPTGVTRSVTGDKKNQNFKEQSPRAISGRLAILPARAALASVLAYAVIIYNFPCLINRQFRKLFAGKDLSSQETFKLVSGHLVFVTEF